MPKRSDRPALKRTYRLPEDVLAELEAIADKERRPVGAQITKFLEESIAEYRRRRGNENWAADPMLTQR